ARARARARNRTRSADIQHFDYDYAHEHRFAEHDLSMAGKASIRLVGVRESVFPQDYSTPFSTQPVPKCARSTVRIDVDADTVTQLQHRALLHLVLQPLTPRLAALSP